MENEVQDLPFTLSSIYVHPRLCVLSCCVGGADITTVTLTVKLAPCPIVDFVPVLLRFLILRVLPTRATFQLRSCRLGSAFQENAMGRRVS